MNDHNLPTTLHEYINIFYKYIYTHYFYYYGVIIGMLLDCDKWDRWIDLIKYIIISVLIANLTSMILIHGGASLHVSILITTIMGVIGHKSFRYGVEVSLPLILKALTNKIIYFVSKK